MEPRRLFAVDQIKISEDFASQINQSGCRLCPLAKSRSTIIRPIARGACDTHPVMIVMSQPTESDDEKGRPSGERMNLLRKWLDKAGVDNCYLTMAVKCYSGNDEDSEKISIDTCIQKFLREEVIKVNPRVIVVMSSQILEAMIPGAPKFFAQQGMPLIVDYMGSFINMKDRLVMPITSPHYIIAKGAYSLEPVIVDSLKRAKDASSLLGAPFSIRRKT